MSSSRKYSVQALFAGITWGCSGTLASLLPEGFTSLSIGAFRLLIGGLFLLAYSGKHIGRILRPVPGEGKTLLLSIVAITLTQISFFTAVLKAGVGLSTMIYIGLSPLFAGLIEHFVDRTPLTSRWYRSVGMTLAGSIVLAWINWEYLVDPTGLLFALGACLGWSLTGLTMKRLQKNRSSLDVTTLVMFLGGLVMTPLLIRADWMVIPHIRTIVPLILLGVLSASVPYALFNRSLEGIPAGHAFVLGMTEPLTAALLGIIVLGEAVSAVHVFGYGLIFIGVVLMYLSGGQRS